jgi:hypothetical protein
MYYQMLRLYRQEQPGQDWSGVVRRIAGNLTDLMQIRSRDVPLACAAPLV